VGQERIGVLLLNLGGPDSLDDVQPFLYNLFADPDIIRLPQPVQFLQPAIAQLVSTLRAPKSREGYESIGGGSPLRRITEEQAGALRDALRDKGINAQTYVAMRYWYPFTEEAIAAVKRDGITRLVVLPLYPQFSVSTSGSSLRLLERLLKEDPVLARVRCHCPRSSTFAATIPPAWRRIVEARHPSTCPGGGGGAAAAGHQEGCCQGEAWQHALRSSLIRAPPLLGCR
jgi:ferrochelatase